MLNMNVTGVSRAMSIWKKTLRKLEKVLWRRAEMGLWNTDDIFVDENSSIIKVIHKADIINSEGNP